MLCRITMLRTRNKAARGGTSLGGGRLRAGSRSSLVQRKVKVGCSSKTTSDKQQSGGATNGVDSRNIPKITRSHKNDFSGTFPKKVIHNKDKRKRKSVMEQDVEGLNSDGKNVSSNDGIMKKSSSTEKIREGTTPPRDVAKRITATDGEMKEENKRDVGESVRRSSRVKRSKSALELLGVQVKDKLISRSNKSKKLENMKLSSNSVISTAAHERVTDSPRSVNQDITSMENKPCLKKRKIQIDSSGSPRNITSHAETSSVIMVGDADESCSRNEPKDDEANREGNSNTQKPLTSGSVTMPPEVNDDVKRQVKTKQHSRCDSQVKPKTYAISRSGRISAKQLHSKSCVPLVGTTTCKNKEQSLRLSRSGRVLASPRKFSEYTTMTKVGRSPASSQNTAKDKSDQGLLAVISSSRKRAQPKSIDTEDSGNKEAKVVTERSDTALVSDDPKCDTVINAVRLELEKVKSECVVTSDETATKESYFENDKCQPLQAELCTDGTMTLTECVVDQKENMITIDESELHNQDDVSSCEQPDCVASTVVIKSDPDKSPGPEEHESDGRLPLDYSVLVQQSDPEEVAASSDNTMQTLEASIVGQMSVIADIASDHVVVISTESRTDVDELTYDTLIRLASEAVHQVDQCDSDMVYQVELGDGKTTHFMFKKGPLSQNEKSSVTLPKPSQESKDEKDVKLLTSEELEKHDQLLGKTMKGRSRPIKQMVVKKELQELVDSIKPSDCIEQHVVIETGAKDKELTAGNYRVRGRHMKCKYCSKPLRDRHDFYKHIRTHREVDYRPFACPLCDYKANIKAAVVRHINIHSEVMPYVCTMCGRGFNFKQKLQTHMKYHKDIRDYQCPNCPLAFHEYKTLKNHIRIIHGPNALIPSGEEAKGLKQRASALSLLAATRPQAKSKETEEDITVSALNEDRTCDVRNDGETSGERSEDAEKSSQMDPEQIENDASTSAERSHCGTETNIVSSDVISCSASERGRLRMSKYIGTKKTQIITERYREGLTKFGASHEEIAASCPWRSSNKSRNHFPMDKTDSPSPNHTTATEYEPNVNICQEDIAAATSIQQVDVSSGLNSVSTSGLVEESVVGDENADLANTESLAVQSNQDTAQTAESAKGAPVVYIQPLGQTDRPPAATNTTQKSPFVSLKNLTSTFDEVCLTETCKNGKEEWLRYRCRLCDHITYNKTVMVDHIQTRHTEVKLWQCPHCDYKCRLRSSIFVHMKMHEADKKYKCDQCGKCYTLYSKLKYHLYTHSTNAQYRCEQCDKKFKRRSDLKKHEDRIHNPDRPFRCEVCDKTFKDKVQIRRHMDSHIEGRNLLCHVCRKYYKNRSSLQQHLKSHMCRFYCELCNKSFGSYSGFMAHKVMHTESFTGFHCDLCGKVLHTKGSLNRHLTISHSTARPYPCLQCKSAFKTKKDLRNHAIVHCSTKNFQCSVCGFKSKRCESLHVHMRRHQDVKPYRCGICDKEYMQRRSLQLHMPYHLNELQLRCNICNRQCMSKSHLQQHIKREHIGADSDLSLIEVGKKSSTPTFYMCEECNSVFLTQDNLAVHILVKHMNQPHDLKVQLKTAHTVLTPGGDDVSTEVNVDIGETSEAQAMSQVNTTVISTDMKSDIVIDSNVGTAMNAGDVNTDVIESLFGVVGVGDEKDIVTRYVAVGESQSPDVTTVTQNVEVEGEVVMNIGEADSDPNAGVVAMPMSAVSMAFITGADYVEGDEFSTPALVGILTPAGAETEVVTDGAADAGAMTPLADAGHEYPAPADADDIKEAF